MLVGGGELTMIRKVPAGFYQNYMNACKFFFNKHHIFMAIQVFTWDKHYSYILFMNIITWGGGFQKNNIGIYNK